MRTPRFATLRIALLLGLLVAAWLHDARQRTASRAWTAPLDVVVFPIPGDDDPATLAYVRALGADDFAPVDAWASREARRHGLALEAPFRTSLGAPVTALPPALPAEPGPLRTLAWGLHFRWWAWRHAPDDARGNGAEDDVEPSPVRVRLFVVYHADRGGPLAHSLGLQKGLLGLVHAYATPSQGAQNNIVLAHELLHTLGATDKYDALGGPRFPEGYADPDREPLHPQRRAEIMAGRAATGERTSRMAGSLESVVVNAWTAREIAWLR